MRSEDDGAHCQRYHHGRHTEISAPPGCPGARRPPRSFGRGRGCHRAECTSVNPIKRIARESGGFTFGDDMALDVVVAVILIPMIWKPT